MNLIRVFTLLFLLICTGLVFGRISTELDQAVDRIVIHEITRTEPPPVQV